MANAISDLEALISTIDRLSASEAELNKVNEKIVALNDQIAVSEGDMQKELIKTQDKLSERQQLLQKTVQAQTADVEAQKASVGVMGKLSASTQQLANNVKNGTGALGSMTKSFPMLNKGISGVIKGFRALLANPIALFIAAVVMAFKSLKDSVSQNEEQMGRLRTAFAVFNPIIDGVKNTITAVADVFVTLSKKFSEFAEKIIPKIQAKIGTLGLEFKRLGLVIKNLFTFDKAKSDALQKEIKALDEEIEETTNNIVANSEEQIKWAKELQAMQEQLAIDQRKANERASELEAKIQEQREIIKDKEFKTYAERQEAMKKASAYENELANTTLSIAKKKLFVLQEEAKRTAKSAEMNDKLSKAQVEVTQAQKNASKVALQLQRDQQMLNKEQEAYVKSLEKMAERVDLTPDKFEKNIDEITEKITSIKDELKKDNLDDVYREYLTKALNNHETYVAISTEAYNTAKAIEEALKKEIERIQGNISKQSDKLNLFENIDPINIGGLKSQLTTLGFELDDAYNNLKQAEITGNEALISEANKNIDSILLRANNVGDALKAGYKEIASTALSSASNIAGAMSDMYKQQATGEKEGSKAQKRALKKSKAFAKGQIATSTAQAIMGTWASYADGGVAGAILASIQTAALTIAGLTQWRNVDNDKISNSSSSAVSSANTGASALEMLNNSASITNLQNQSTQTAPQTVLVVSDVSHQQNFENNSKTKAKIG